MHEQSLHSVRKRTIDLADLGLEVRVVDLQTEQGKERIRSCEEHRAGDERTLRPRFDGAAHVSGKRADAFKVCHGKRLEGEDMLARPDNAQPVGCTECFNSSSSGLRSEQRLQQ